MIWVVLLITVIFILIFVAKPKNAKERIGSDISTEKFREKMANLCFVDIETTGLNHSKDRIIEYSFLKHKMSADNVDHEMLITTSLVNPEGIKSHPEAYQVHGISDSSLLGEKAFSTHIEKIVEFVGNRTLVAHNASFEEKFFKEEFRRAGIHCNLSFLDSLSIIRDEYPGLKSYSLSALCKHLKIERTNSHRAEADVIALFQVIVSTRIFH